MSVATARLSETQTAQYRDEGYVLFREPVFSNEKFEALKDHFESKLTALPEGARPESMDVPHFTDTTLFDWLLADEVLDIVEPILGPDIGLFSSHFICKPPGDGKRVPWHEDTSYWNGMLSHPEVVTVWLAIDPSTEENGCMRIIPGTHLTPGSDYRPVADRSGNVFGTEIVESQLDESKAASCVLAPNECSLHDGRLVHGSEANTSAMRRCGYTMRYFSTRTRFLHENRGEVHQVYLARGRDHAGNVFGDPNQADHELMDRRQNRKRPD